MRSVRFIYLFGGAAAQSKLDVTKDLMVTGRCFGNPSQTIY